jgi:hypothetical protein
VRFRAADIQTWLDGETWAAAHGDREQAAAAIERCADDDI